MTTNPDQTTAESIGKASVEDTEKYVLRTRREIIPLLKALTKKPDPVTAKIPDSTHTMITAVLDVLPNKNLMVLDYGPAEALNKKLLAADRVICTTRHEMVETRFNCSNLKQVKYKGEPAFAVPLPDSVLHLQRRGYFRIKPLTSHPAYLGLTLENDQVLNLKLIDIGIKGLSLQDNLFRLHTAQGKLFENCKLTLPANPSLNVNFELRYSASSSSRDGQEFNRVGGRFINLNPNDEFNLQRFINMVQIEQNALIKG